MRTQEKSMSNRILAIILCMVMLFGMIPTSLVTAADLDYGTAEALTPGGVISGDPASLVLTYESAELEWVDVDASQGRNQAGWYIGMRLHAPEALVTESDYRDGENEVTIQTKGFKGWSSTNLSFWDNQNSDINSAEAKRYIDFWFYLDESRLISGKMNEELSFGVKADWNKDGSYEQEVIMDIVPAGVTLKKDGNVVFPLTGAAKVSVLNSDGTVNPDANIEGNGTDYVVVTPAATTYTWVATDESIGRPQDGWWAGIRIDVPENADISAAKLKIGEYVATVEEEVFVDGNAKYVPVWKSLNAFEGKTVNNASVSVTNIEFDWNADGIYEQCVAFSVDHNKVTLMKDEVQEYPLYAATVTMNEGGSAVVKDTENTSKVVNKGEEVVFVATANAGYQIHSINNVVYTEQDKTTAEIPVKVEEDTEVTVVFEKVHTVTVNLGENGQISVEGMELNAGAVVVAHSEIEEKLTVTATPNAGYTVTEFTVNDIPQDVTDLDASVAYTAELDPADYQITVAFTDKTPATITVTTAPADGWDNEKSFAFTVEDSTGAACAVYVCELDLAAFQTALKEGTIEEYTESSYSVAEDISEVGKDFYIYAVDPAGNITQETVRVKQVDTQAPKISQVREVTFGWGNSKRITYSFNVSDLGGSEINKVIYTTDINGVDGIKTATKTIMGYSFTEKADGKQYYIFAYDNAGNVVTTAPKDTAPIIAKIATPTEWVKDEYTIAFVVESDSASYTVYYSEEQYDQADEIVDAKDVVKLEADDQGPFAFTVKKNATYYVYAIDAEDNMNVVPVEINRIDNTVPVVEAPVKDPTVEWFNDKVVISGSATDKQEDVENVQPKVERVRYSTEQEYSENTSELATFNKDTGEYSFSIDTADDKILDQTYYIWAIDEVGHVSEAVSTFVKIDKVKPVGTVSVKDYETTWTKLFANLSFGIYRNNDVTVSLTCSDVDDTNSGVNNVQYFIADIAADSTAGLSEEALIAEYEAGEFEAYPSEGVIINTNRRSAVYFRVEDKASNVTYLNSDGIIRDDTPPIGTIAVQKQDPETEEFMAWNSWSDFPQGDFDNRSFACYSNTALKVIITADEEEGSVASGIKSIMYYKHHDILSHDQIKEIDSWEEYTEVLECIDNERLVIYARIEDNAGNVTYLSTDGIIVDNKKPSGAETEETQIIITPEKDNLVEDSGIYKGDVTVSVTVYDPKFVGSMGSDSGDFSGLAGITYRVYATDTEAETKGILYKTVLEPDEEYGALLVDPDVDHATPDSGTGLISTWAGQIKIPAATFNSNNVVVEITAIDNAGNSRESSTNAGDIKIDVTAPIITVENYPDADAYLTGTREVKVLVQERNFDDLEWNVPESLHNQIVARHNSKFTIGSWVEEPVAEEDQLPNGDHITHSVTITFDKDDHYTMSDIIVTDLAENPSEVYTLGEEFTIDNAAPQVTVSYDNNSAQNGKYFNATRTATITVTEHNFDPARVNITVIPARGGQTRDLVARSNWELASESGDTHIAVVEFDVDGDYTFDISVDDLAGNTCPSGSVNYGDSVAAREFVIDTDAEMISQEGVENGVAYGHDAEVIPNVKIEDINLQDYTVTLTGVQKDKTIDLTEEVNALLDKGTETVTGIFDIFETKQDLDGIYMLKMTSKDKAGNEDSMEIVFTVNRFGSVYVFEDYLLNLVKDGGAFVQKIDSDLVITEFNADKLVADSLKIEITVDGKPLENVQYTVTPEINDTVSVGSSGWYQYKYTISKDNFAADGVYKISVSSEDATGNTPENSNYEDKGMTFRVDSTQSEISSVVGLEEAIINAQEVTVKYTIYDTIGIKSVIVYVDGKSVDEITDFSEDPNNYSGSFTLAENSSTQAVRIVVEDMAGNITDTNAEDFAPVYEFNGSVTVSTNIFVRWYANKPLFWGSIGGVTVVAGALWFFLVGKKKKK